MRKESAESHARGAGVRRRLVLSIVTLRGIVPIALEAGCQRASVLVRRSPLSCLQGAFREMVVISRREVAVAIPQRPLFDFSKQPAYGDRSDDGYEITVSTVVYYKENYES